MIRPCFFLWFPDRTHRTKVVLVNNWYSYKKGPIERQWEGSGGGEGQVHSWGTLRKAAGSTESWEANRSQCPLGITCQYIVFWLLGFYNSEGLHFCYISYTIYGYFLWRTWKVQLGKPWHVTQAWGSLKRTGCDVKPRVQSQTHGCEASTLWSWPLTWPPGSSVSLGLPHSDPAEIFASLFPSLLKLQNV